MAVLVDRTLMADKLNTWKMLKVTQACQWKHDYGRCDGWNSNGPIFSFVAWRCFVRLGVPGMDSTAQLMPWQVSIPTLVCVILSTEMPKTYTTQQAQVFLFPASKCSNTSEFSVYKWKNICRRGIDLRFSSDQILSDSQWDQIDQKQLELAHWTGVYISVHSYRGRINVISNNLKILTKNLIPRYFKNQIHWTILMAR